MQILDCNLKSKIYKFSSWVLAENKEARGLFSIFSAWGLKELFFRSCLKRNAPFPPVLATDTFQPGSRPKFVYSSCISRGTLFAANKHTKPALTTDSCNLNLNKVTRASQMSKRLRRDFITF